MTSISRQLDLPYSAAQMYALVNDVARYPEFVPGCERAIIEQMDGQIMRASLMIHWHGVRSTLTTENKLIENQSITMNLAQGLLKHLAGQWQFVARNEQACQVTLSIDVAFKSHFTALLFSRVVQQVLNRVMIAFCDRAKALYG